MLVELGARSGFGRGGGLGARQGKSLAAPGASGDAEQDRGDAPRPSHQHPLVVEHQPRGPTPADANRTDQGRGQAADEEMHQGAADILPYQFLSSLPAGFSQFVHDRLLPLGHWQPKHVITDRGTAWTSRFWKALGRKLNITLHFSSKVAVLMRFKESSDNQQWNGLPLSRSHGDQYRRGCHLMLLFPLSKRLTMCFTKKLS